MASKSSRPDSPEVDFSVIRTSIDMGHKMVDQILHGIHYGSDEVRNLLREECDFILECKVCRNLFRSFPNFVAHKRVYCVEYYEEKMQSEAMQTKASDTETIVVQPVAPEDQDKSSKNKPSTSSVVKEVIANAFKGKSKEYQFYTKVAEDVEKSKVTKTTKSIVLTSMPGCSTAVQVKQFEGDVTESSSIQNSEATKKQSPVKNTEKSKTSPAKNKNSIKDLCADLMKKQLGEINPTEMTPISNARPLRVTNRSRKSSPRRSLEYFDGSTSNSATNDDDESEPMAVDVVTPDDENESSEGDSINKDILVFCDTKKLLCKVCKIAFLTATGLSKHVEQSHVKTVVKHRCPCCKQSFREFSFLTQHLKNVHQKNDMFINGLKARLNSRTYDKFEPNPSNSPVKSNKVSSLNEPSGKLLSYSTGWKKCDKCSKVCWKAKSYRRHYASCKGPVPSQTSSPEKQKPQQNPVNNSAFTKLEEKLRASVIKTIYPEDVGKKTTGKKVNVESEGPSVKNVSSEQRAKQSKDIISSKDGVSDYRSGQFCRGKQAIANAMRLLQSSAPSTTSSSVNLNNNTRAVTSGSTQAKSYNLRLGNISGDNSNPNEKLENSREVTGSKSIKETSTSSSRPSDGGNVSKDANRESPGLKKLEKRLVREAGLQENTKVIYPCRNLFKEKLDNNDELGKSSKSDSDIIESPLVVMKERRTRNESPEIKQLMEKLTREACEPGEKLDDNQSEKDTVTEAVEINDEEKPVQTAEKSSIDENVKGQGVTESKIENEVKTSERRSRTLRRESAPVQSSEKLTLDTNLSPASSPGRTNNPASSPTPSMTSNDSYNLKFKMTVQEMAELVESASLTKFAKERKNRARTILNKKSIKEAQKSNPSLSRPMKRKYDRKKVVIRNVYGTRNRDKSSSHLDETLNNSSLTPLAKTEAQAKKLSREQKRLMNSAGFVEENLYRVASVTKELEKDSDTDKLYRKSRFMIARKSLMSGNTDTQEMSSNCIDDSNEKNMSENEVSMEEPAVNDTEMNEDNSSGEKVSDKKDTSSVEIIDVSKTYDKSVNEIDKSKNSFEEKSKLGKTSNISKKTKNVRNSSGTPIEKVQLSARESRDSNEKISNEENAKNESESRHRTRLSTGSIYFDSELLKLSPKKVEKIISERKKQSDEKGDNPVDTSESVTVKITHNDRRTLNSGHSRSKSAPQFYSIATGVKQCPKCMKRFWKHLTYTNHMKHSSCSDKKAGKPSRKRALSITGENENDSPEKTDSTDSRSKRMRGISDTNSEKSESNTDKNPSEIQGTKDTSSIVKLVDNGNSGETVITQGSDNLRNATIDEVDSINVTKNDDENKKKSFNRVVKMDSSQGTELVANSKQELEETDCESVGIEAVAGPSGTSGKQVNKKDKNGDDDDDYDDESGSDFSGFSEDDLRISELELSQTQTDLDDSIIIEDEDISMNEVIDLDNINENDDDGDDDDDFSDEVNDLMHGAKLLFDMKQKQKYTRSSIQDMLKRSPSNVTPKRSPSNATPKRSQSNATPKPSQSNSASKSQASKQTQQQPVSKVTPQQSASKVTPQQPVTNATDPTSATKVTDQTSESRNAREKSPNIEEIWVYKRPGKPVTTLKIKGGNREFVTDINNPNKLVVHCTKEVDKLIDEENMKCQQCDSPCTSISNLRRHVIRHLGWKRYKCKKCTFSCYDLSHCRMHTSRLHQITLTNSNFDDLMTDLKREANALRSVKRRRTRQKTKDHISDEDIYKKTFP